MGKLTYVNRKIEGGKLTLIVSRDIAKRIPPNLSHKAALRDPIIDFDISGKSMGDDDLKKISQELVKAINYQNPDRVLILEEVSLRGNKFSPLGLATFASVIEASSTEIRSLDLSDNIIEIVTTEDATAWEIFLQSFSQCTALHRLDLSGNKLGRKGFELLLKTYAFEDGLIACEEANKAQFGGLRSIPYICLSDTGLDDICAMHLSYLLETHGFVEELLPTLPQPKPGSQTHQLEAYDEIEGCNGIIWKPNSVLHDLGTKVLEAAESLRKSRVGLQRNDNTDEELSQSISEVTLSTSQRSPCEAHSGGDSLLSQDDSFHFGSSDTTCDLMRARSRIMLDALKIGGIQQNDLWISAFKILQYTRAILFGFGPDNSPLRKQGYRFTRNVENKERSQTFPPLPSQSGISRALKTRKRSIESGSLPRAVLTKVNPNVLIQNKVSLDRNGAGNDIYKPVSISSRSKTHRVYDLMLHLTPETMKQYSRQYHGNLVYRLPRKIWIKIITYASDSEGVLSDNQRAAAIGWAANRESIVELRGVVGKHTSQQMYKALEGLGCLTYDI